jgi:hypothetical protein
MTTAHLPDMYAPVVFCQECATGFCMVVWDVDRNGEPTIALSDSMNYCPVCGAKQQIIVGSVASISQSKIMQQAQDCLTPEEFARWKQQLSEAEDDS